MSSSSTVSASGLRRVSLESLLSLGWNLSSCYVLTTLKLSLACIKHKWYNVMCVYVCVCMCIYIYIYTYIYIYIYIYTWRVSLASLLSLGGRERSSGLLDLCVSSLRRGHANLLCIVPILTDEPRRESMAGRGLALRHVCFVFARFEGRWDRGSCFSVVVLFALFSCSLRPVCAVAHRGSPLGIDAMIRESIEVSI